MPPPRASPRPSGASGRQGLGGHSDWKQRCQDQQWTRRHIPLGVCAGRVLRAGPHWGGALLLSRVRRGYGAILPWAVRGRQRRPRPRAGSSRLPSRSRSSPVPLVGTSLGTSLPWTSSRARRGRRPGLGIGSGLGCPEDLGPDCWGIGDVSTPIAVPGRPRPPCPSPSRSSVLVTGSRGRSPAPTYGRWLGAGTLRHASGPVGPNCESMSGSLLPPASQQDGRSGESSLVSDVMD